MLINEIIPMQSVIALILEYLLILVVCLPVNDILELMSNCLYKKIQIYKSVKFVSRQLNIYFIINDYVSKYLIVNHISQSYHSQSYYSQSYYSQLY